MKGNEIVDLIEQLVDEKINLHSEAQTQRGIARAFPLDALNRIKGRLAEEIRAAFGRQ